MEIKAISRKTLTPPEGYFLVSLRGKGKDVSSLAFPRVLGRMKNKDVVIMHGLLDINQPQKNITESTLAAALARICMISRRSGD